MVWGGVEGHGLGNGGRRSRPVVFRPHLTHPAGASYQPTTAPHLRSKELCIEVCDLTYLQIVGAELTRGLGPDRFTDLLPGLDRIVITRPVLCSEWSP